MSRHTNFYTKLEQYSQKKNKLYNINPDKNYKYKFSRSNSGKHIVELSDEEKVVLKGEFQLVGMYNMINSFWYWGWSIDHVNRKLVELVEKVKEFPDKLKEDYQKYDPVEYNEVSSRELQQ